MTKVLRVKEDNSRVFSIRLYRLFFIFFCYLVRVEDDEAEESRRRSRDEKWVLLKNIFQFIIIPVVVDSILAGGGKETHPSKNQIGKGRSILNNNGGNKTILRDDL